MDAEDRDWYTLRQAARRVHRSLRTLRRWKRHGMPIRMVEGTNYVEHHTLLNWWRDRLTNDAARARHRARLAREAEIGDRLASTEVSLHNLSNGDK